MLNQNYKNNIEEVTSGVTTTNFSIEVNESMFQMLTSDIYSDTTLAVMREWSTNACDACITAGKPIKYDVHLPLFEEPEFFVRDYGTGLAPEDIVGLFSNLGASTKRDSNATNGTFGIGRMAGLAVSSSFTVESFYQGYHYTYVISMKNGIPVTMHLGDKATTEPDGLKLSVKVDFSDIGAYETRASNLYKFFDHKPTLNKEINIELDKSEHISDDWFITVKNPNMYNQPNYVVMSQIAYQIPDSYDVANQGFKNLVIRAEPGAVTFNPGRETLSLDKKTIDFLNTTFMEVIEGYVAQTTAAFARADSDYEILKIFNAVTTAAPASVGKQIDPALFLTPECQSLLIQDGRGHRLVTGGDTFKGMTNSAISLNYKSNYYAKARKVTPEKSINWTDFFFSPHILIDLKTNYRTPLNALYPKQKMVTWSRGEGTSFDDSVIEIEKFLKVLDLPYVKASALLPQVVSTKTTNLPREGLYTSSIVDGIVSASERMPDDDVEAETYLYLKLKNMTPTLSNSIVFADLMIAYNALRRVTTMPRIVGVAKKYQGYVDNLDNWVDIETYISRVAAQTTFREPISDDIPRMDSKVIDCNNYNLYPVDLQEFYLELTAYYEFNESDNYLDYEFERKLMSELGATFETFEPTRDIDIGQLEEVYKIVLPFMTGKWNDYCDVSLENVIRIAQLEEFHAVHTPKR
jgi:hypothetical protein